jgi:outer membrane lipoprotein SlyB
MKKTISLMVALALFASTAFAAPISVAASLDEPVTAQTVVSSEQAQTAPELFSATDESDTLFVNVRAVALTEAEASGIEGDGLFGAIFGAIVGGAVGAATGGSTGAATGAIAGGIIGALLPF